MTEMTPEEIVLKHARVPAGDDHMDPMPVPIPVDEPDDEIVVPVPKVSIKGRVLSIPPRQMLEPLIDHVINCNVLGHGPVQAKLLEVNDTHTKIIVTEDKNK